MARIDKELLNAALRDKLLRGRPNRNQEIYLPRTILTAWEIVLAVEAAGEKGVTEAELLSVLSIEANTLSQYSAWLRGRNLVVYRRFRRAGYPRIYYPPASRRGKKCPSSTQPES